MLTPAYVLTRNPGFPSLPSSPSKPAGPCRTTGEMKKARETKREMVHCRPVHLPCPALVSDPVIFWGPS